jgi:hypothetical protein
VPGPIEASVAIVNCDEAGAVTVAGAKDALAPVGKPATVNPTLPVNPFVEPTAML